MATEIDFSLLNISFFCRLINEKEGFVRSHSELFDFMSLEITFLRMMPKLEMPYPHSQSIVTAPLKQPSAPVKLKS